MLDMFQQAFDQEAAPKANEGRDLPPTFGESFQDAWSNGQLATSGIKQDNARTQAIQEYTDQINKASGGAVDAEYGKQLAEGSGITTVDAAGGGPDPLEVANGVVAKMKASADASGQKLPFTPMSSDDIDTRAAQISGQAIAANAAMQGRPQTLGSRVGGFLGGAASAAVDPYNIPLMAIPVEGLGVLGTAAAFGAASAATQAVNEGVNAGFNEKVQPGYNNSGQAMANIAEAGVSGALMGGGIKAAGNVLTRLMTGAWPTAAKDAANGIMSEADILNSNTHAPIEPTLPEVRPGETPAPRAPIPAEAPTIMEPGSPAVAPGIPERDIAPGEQILPGAEGEAAHTAAIGKAIDDVLKGNPVDVSDAIPPGSDFESRIGDLPSDYGTTASISEGEPVEATPFRPGALAPDDLQAALASPEAMNAARSDVEKAIDESAQGGKALQIPTGVDVNGEPIWGSATSALGEVDRMNELANQIAQCALPGAMQEAAE